MSTENGRPHILVADDQSDVLEALRLLLKGNGFDVDTTTSPSAALAALERRDYDAMLLDMRQCRDEVRRPRMSVVMQLCSAVSCAAQSLCRTLKSSPGSRLRGQDETVQREETHVES